MYFIAVKGIGAEESEGHVAAKAYEGQKSGAEGDSWREEVAVVVVVEQVVPLC